MPLDRGGSSLAGQEECDQACEELEEASRRLVGKRRHGAAEGAQKLLPLPLYAALPAAAQLKAFDPPPRGYRKVCPVTVVQVWRRLG